MRDVVAAFAAALEDQELTVYKGKAAKGAKAPYVVVYVPVPRPSDRSVAARHTGSRWRIATLYVGTSLDSVLWVAEKATTALLDQRLEVDATQCSPMVREAGRLIEPDTDDMNIFSATDTWTFATSPGPASPPPEDPA